MVEKNVKIQAARGVDIKVAANFTNIANKFKCEVWLKKGNVEVNGKSILGIISLALISGEEIIIKTIGDDEKECAEKLLNMLS